MSQQEDQNSYRKKMVHAIRRKGLEPKCDSPEYGELEEYVYVLGKMIGRLRAYGISDELIARLDKVRWDPDKLDESVSEEDARLIANRTVDEVFYGIERVIRQIDLLNALELAPSGEELDHERKAMASMQAQDKKRAEFVRKWSKRNMPPGEEKIR